jgi:hypothetical protein
MGRVAYSFQTKSQHSFQMKKEDILTAMPKAGQAAQPEAISRSGYSSFQTKKKNPHEI